MRARCCTVWVFGLVVMAWNGAAAQLVGTGAGVGRGRDAPPLAPLASLAIPGLGQALLGDARALAYVAVEAYALVEYRTQHAEGNRARTMYRAVARDVARAFVGGIRPDGPFEYYEAMEKFVASGAFDRIPGGDVDPEIDETTYNGFVWRLARDTYWSDPDVPPAANSSAYANAISMYVRRAAVDDYRWSWRDAALEHDVYRRAVRRSNAAFRRAREQLGLVLVNHLLSMVDAFATVRVRTTPTDARQSTQIEVQLPWPGWLR